MIDEGLLAGVCGVAAYAASTAIEIELPNGGRVSPAVAFGPALAALGGYIGGVPLVAIFGAAVAVQLLIVGVARRQLLSSTSHGLGLVVTFVLAQTYGHFRLEGYRKTVGLLVLVALGSVAYFGIDLLLETSVSARRGLRGRLLIEGVRAGVPVVVVLASTAGLIVLVLPRMGWATFLVMFVPVLATRHEFARYGRASRTYDETVRTLAALAEGAGYVPQGHSTRVAELCVEIGRELSLRSDRLRELELVGLLHDVGAVSLADPSDLREVDPEHVARSTGYLLEETGYLSAYAEIVLDVARGKRDLPLEGRILRVADTFERLGGSTRRRLRMMTAAVFPEDAEVVAALKRVIAVP